MRLLIYTDSRGQHTPRGEPVHDVFPLRLAALPDVKAEVYLCPMKWTTTIDFLDLIKTRPPQEFDHVILFTGIVDWSPRPKASAFNDLYANVNPANLDNAKLNTREYARKVVNFKKTSFDEIFTELAMLRHLQSDLGVEYEGQPTNNMYSLEMAERSLLPRLKAIDNLIFVNSNRFIPGWEGDYARGRPANIAVTERYSALFRDVLGASRVIDLLEWQDSDIRQLTCDNLHLTKAGSDWIYDRLCERLGILKPRVSRSATPIKDTAAMNMQNHPLPANRPARRSDTLLLIGNGPSTKKLAAFGFHNLPATIDTFGMGAAYRYYSMIGWWPDYYAWCDAKVVHSHRHAFQNLIEDPAVSTRAFYFSLPISEHERFHHVPHSSTGDFCFRKAVELGYSKIFLIGVEGDYVEEIPESRALSDREFDELGYAELFPLFEHLSPDRQQAFSIFRDYLRIIDRTPAHNPNYFFDGYQRQGDVFSLPRAATHRNSWRKSAEFAAKHGVSVINLSESSKIEQFRKASWDQFVKFVSKPAPPPDPFAPFGRPIETPLPMSAEEKRSALIEAGLSTNEKLATLVIGVRFPEGDEVRSRNLRVLLDWIDHYYGDLFDVLLMEQDSVSRIDSIKAHLRPYVRHAFAYNPKAYNRGWGYNVAVRHFTNAKVVGLLDTDVLTGANFVREIIDCHTKYKAVSPYTNIYYTDPEEAAEIGLTFGLAHLRTAEHIAKPTTICGGIVIVRRDAFLAVAGFEQYIEFAGEDRSLDVTLLNTCAPGELRVAPYTYAHLNHPYHSEPRPLAKELFAHLHSQYGCKVDKTITILDDIHKNCRHVSKEKTAQNSEKRRPVFGDLELYRSGRPLAVNGVYAEDASSAPGEPATTAASTALVEQGVAREPIFPPAFKTLGNYVDKELYQAPEPDAAKLAKLYNMFKGKRCFIIGNGPSLNKHDLSLLKDEYAFAVNSFYYKTAETGFRPTFFVVEDNAVMRENIEQIRAYEAPYKFFPTNYRDLHPPAANTYFFRMNRGFYEKSSPNYCVPRFSTDASKVLYCGQSVTYINLQLAFFMGFTEVYLIGMDFDYVIPPEHERTGDFILSTTDDPNHFHKDYFGKGKTWKDPKLERVAANYRQAKVAYESVGRSIYNATIGGKLEIFERVDYNHLLKTGVKRRPAASPQPAGAPTAILERPRAAHAHLMETKVVSTLLQQRRGPDRVMLDVGAHYGNTASYFHELGWTVHCFEPDPNNRAKLLAKYAGVATVSIDPRAVSDKPAKNVAFFTSEESTGISGLLAFHETHRQSALVDITTLRDVIAERGIKRVDFLKIDVEGYDLNVLKGVPWEVLKPDVIECEFEDAKTLKLGHTSHDVAKFLQRQGYTVYVSEWHPIVRYGIRHDWSRLWRYPSYDLPATAWGNFIAFREDPGYDAVRAAFEANMRLYPDKPAAPAKAAAVAPKAPVAASTPAQPAPPAQPVTVSPPAAPIAASAPHTQAASSPAPAVETPPAATPLAFYAPFGDWLRTRSPRLFALLRIVRRAAAGVWRRRALTLPAAVLLAILPVAAFLPGMEAERPWLLGAGAFLIALATTIYVAIRLYTFAFGSIEEARQLTAQIGELKTSLSQLQQRANNSDAAVSTLRATAKALETKNLTLRADLDKRVAALKTDATLRAAEMDTRLVSLRQDLTASSAAALEARERTLRQDFDASIESMRAELDAQYSSIWNELGALTQGMRSELEIHNAALVRRGHELESNVAALQAALEARLEDTVRQIERLHSATEHSDEMLRSQLAGQMETIRGELASHEAQMEERLRALRSAVEALDSAQARSTEEKLAELRAAAEARIAAQERRTQEKLDALKADGEARIAAQEQAARESLEALGAAYGARSAAQEQSTQEKLDALKADAEARIAAQEQAAQESLEALKSAYDARIATQERSTQERLDALKAAAEARIAAQERAARESLEALKAAYDARIATQEQSTQEKLDALKAAAEARISAQEHSAQQKLTAVAADIAQREKNAIDTIRREFVRGRGARLRERIASTERQLAELRYPDAPKTMVFFGHHKCASRFFREEVFTIAAEAAGARVRRYQIKEPPFHYSMSDELDLVNIDFTGLGENGRDAVLFSNATLRSLERINRATQDWRGLRIVRDPRQVLVSNYFHHKGEHPFEAQGWVWDQLKKDKPILNELPEEEGLLYELDSISKQIIETQVLAPFDDPRVMTIKIEDFSQDPQGHLKRISQFLGVSDIAGLDFNRTAANPNAGPWRRHFTSKLREVFKQRYGQALIELGYAEDTLW